MVAKSISDKLQELNKDNQNKKSSYQAKTFFIEDNSLLKKNMYLYEL